MLFAEVSALYKIGVEDMLNAVISSVIEKRNMRTSKKELKIDSNAI